MSPDDGVRLRVALVTPCFWPEVRRGAERIASELAAGLLERGHRPMLITSHPGFPQVSTERGIPIVRHWRPSERRLWQRGYEEYLTSVPTAYASLRLGHFDVAQAVYPASALAAARWSKRTGRPSILSYMGIPDRQGLSARRWRLEITARAAIECTAVTALSRYVADAFERWLGVRARVIYPGVDLEAFQPARERWEEPTIFCAADPDVPRKRVDLLVAAFRRVRRQQGSAALRLLRPSDPRLAAELGGEPGVTLVDPVDTPEELAPEYGRAWVSALPSAGEALGVVLIESLACGTPAVGTRDGGMPEVIDRDEVGRVFEGEEEELAGALLEALDGATAPSSLDACRERARDFSLERCVAAHEELYRELSN